MAKAPETTQQTAPRCPAAAEPAPSARHAERPGPQPSGGPGPQPSGGPGPQPSGGPEPASGGPEPASGGPEPAPGGPEPAPGGLLDLIDEAVVVADPAGRLRWCNAQARRLVPGLRIGDPLGVLPEQAPGGGADRFDADIGGRRLIGHLADPAAVAEVAGLAGHRVWLVSDGTAAHERERELLAEQSRSAFLAEAGGRLAASLHFGRTLQAVARLAVPVLADTAVVLLPVRRGRLAWQRYGPDESSGRLAAEVLDQVPAAALALRGAVRPAVCRGADLAPLRELLPARAEPVQAALVTALPGPGEPAGALILARGPGRPGFGRPEVRLAQQYAARAGIALAAAGSYAEQVHTAAVVQDGLEPDPLPRVPGVRLGAAYRPGRQGLRIGGDFYQARAGADGGVEFFFGDVCGKGVEAAVFAGRVRQTLRALALVECRPVRLLRLLNQALLESGAAPFTTLVTGYARPLEDGALQVGLAGGGHLPPLLLRGTGRVEEVHIGGTLVGALPDPDFRHLRVRLAPGELMLLYSDGVTEACGGPGEPKMYGDQRLKRDLATCAGMPAGAVAERIDLLIGQWLGGRAHDDIAVLALQAPAARPRDGRGRR